jgi:hypothetical protein
MYEVDGTASCPHRFTTDEEAAVKQWTRGWLIGITSLVTLETKEICSRNRELNCGYSVIQPTLLWTDIPDCCVKSGTPLR